MGWRWSVMTARLLLTATAWLQEYRTGPPSLRAGSSLSLLKDGSPPARCPGAGCRLIVHISIPDQYRILLPSLSPKEPHHRPPICLATPSNWPPPTLFSHGPIPLGMPKTPSICNRSRGRPHGISPIPREGAIEMTTPVTSSALFLHHRHSLYSPGRP